MAGLAERSISGGLKHIHGFDATLRHFFSKIVRYAILILVVIMVLGQFGVQTASIIAAVGAIGLAIGLALQGTLQNIAAGIMLLALRPFRIGEYVEVGAISGTVRGSRPVRHQVAHGRRRLRAGAQLDPLEPACPQLYPQRRPPWRHHADHRLVERHRFRAKDDAQCRGRRTARQAGTGADRLRLDRRRHRRRRLLALLDFGGGFLRHPDRSHQAHQAGLRCRRAFGSRAAAGRAAAGTLQHPAIARHLQLSRCSSGAKASSTGNGACAHIGAKLPVSAVGTGCVVSTRHSTNRQKAAAMTIAT
ncbi:hypothetical protein MEA186_32987 [Mesorhizobium amorphae CCNWGS0123]|uniref:Small-conductance mechanosensitive channel n=1 Tax=Mesorhizobium amorphae CCNWGS0123 TaxID=1082933 RepID=G6YKR2_9HYPH|nr:hypothetical protein MEA186_32987 [Mesorhizobium amorphae CCNWGS0123]